MAKETISQTEGLCKEVAMCIRNAYDKGYKQGVNDGSLDVKMRVDGVYEKGLNDAWECARKICKMNYETRREALGVDDNHDLLGKIFNAFSASEAIDRIKKYEEEKKANHEIKVGDEILIHNIQDAETYKAVVMDIDMDKGLWIFDENACNTVIEPNRYIGEEADIEVRKTGRHFDEIAEVLEQLKEVNK